MVQILQKEKGYSDVIGEWRLVIQADWQAKPYRSIYVMGKEKKMKRKEKNGKKMLKHKRLLNRCFHGSKKTMEFIKFIYFCVNRTRKGWRGDEKKVNCYNPRKARIQSRSMRSRIR